MSALTTYLIGVLVSHEQFWIATTLSAVSMILLELEPALEGLRDGESALQGRLAVFTWGSAVGYAAAGAASGAPPGFAPVIGLMVGALALLFRRVLIVLLSAVNFVQIKKGEAKLAVAWSSYAEHLFRDCDQVLGFEAELLLQRP